MKEDLLDVLDHADQEDQQESLDRTVKWEAQENLALRDPLDHLD